MQGLRGWKEQGDRQALEEKERGGKKGNERKSNEGVRKPVMLVREQ